jgi:uncharacterized protein (TIRG00374 family)
MKKYLKYGLNAVIFIGLIVAGVKYLSGEELLTALREFDYQFAAFILVLAFGYLVLKAWRFVLLLRPLEEELDSWVTFRAYLAGEAAALLPGGIAARAGLLEQADVPVGKGSVSVVFNSGLDQFVLISAALIATLWFEQWRLPVFIIIGIIIFLTILFLIPAIRDWLWRLSDWLAQKFNFKEALLEFVENVPQVFTWRIMLATTALTIASFALHVIALELTTRGVGTELSYAILTVAYVLPTVLGRLSGLPGGFGITEAGMVGFLTTTTALAVGTATAVVAIFRIATIVFGALVGALIYFFWWRGNKETATSAV